MQLFRLRRDPDVEQQVAQPHRIVPVRKFEVALERLQDLQDPTKPKTSAPLPDPSVGRFVSVSLTRIVCCSFASNSRFYHRITETRTNEKTSAETARLHNKGLSKHVFPVHVMPHVRGPRLFFQTISRHMVLQQKLS